MQRKSITEYEYIEFLVNRIKEDHKKGLPSDWCFNELSTRYSPLIFKLCKRLKTKMKTMTISEAKIRIMEWMFDAILRYDESYTDKKKDFNSKFDKVYFSQYLKTKLGWDLHRFLHPSKPDYDDFNYNPKFVALDLKNNNLVAEKFLYVPVKSLSDNFIALCRETQKTLKDDSCGDIMMLHFGYDFKIQEIASMLELPAKKVGSLLAKIKAFWSEERNLEKLIG